MSIQHDCFHAFYRSYYHDSRLTRFICQLMIVCYLIVLSGCSNDDGGLGENQIDPRINLSTRCSIKVLNFEPEDSTTPPVYACCRCSPSGGAICLRDRVLCTAGGNGATECSIECAKN